LEAGPKVLELLAGSAIACDFYDHLADLETAPPGQTGQRHIGQGDVLANLPGLKAKVLKVGSVGEQELTPGSTERQVSDEALSGHRVRERYTLHREPTASFEVDLKNSSLRHGRSVRV
jgi:hypothetical protein